MQHIVRQGECLCSIAKQFGFQWKQLWDLEENAKLREKRKNANVLYPGDILFVPEKTSATYDRSTEGRHKFLLKGTPCKLRIRLLCAGKPLANEPYTLVVGLSVNGTTGADGILEEIIPEEITQGKLLLGEEKLELQLEIGQLDPLTEVSGLQARLNNLGFYCGNVDGSLGVLTRSALSAFQETYDLRSTGEADKATLDRLEKLHGC